MTDSESQASQGTSSDPVLELYARFVRASEQAQLRVTKRLADHGLTASQYSTLDVLKSRGALAQRDIARHLAKTGANITVVVSNLERRGLISRVRHHEDKRIVQVSITPEGAAALARAVEAHNKTKREIMEKLSDSDRAELLRLLSLLP